MAFDARVRRCFGTLSFGCHSAVHTRHGHRHAMEAPLTLCSLASWQNRSTIGTSAVMPCMQRLSGKADWYTHHRCALWTMTLERELGLAV